MMSMWSRLATELAISMTPEEYEEPVLLDEKPMLRRVVAYLLENAWIHERQILEFDPLAFTKDSLFGLYYGKAYFMKRGNVLWSLTATGEKVLWTPE